MVFVDDEVDLLKRRLENKRLNREVVMSWLRLDGEAVHLYTGLFTAGVWY